MKKFILIVLVAILEIGITSNIEHSLGKKSRKQSHVSLLFKSFVCAGNVKYWSAGVPIYPQVIGGHNVDFLKDDKKTQALLEKKNKYHAFPWMVKLGGKCEGRGGEKSRKVYLR